jgi:hypothetical protein
MESNFTKRQFVVAAQTVFLVGTLSLWSTSGLAHRRRSPRFSKLSV